MALASLDAFTARLGRSLAAGPETDRAQAALDDASAYIATFGTLPDTTPPAVIAVVCSVALRLFNNPEGLTSETVGDYTWRVDGAGLFLTPYEEQVVVRATTDSGRTGLWSLRTTRGAPGSPIYGYDQYGGDPILLSDLELDGVVDDTSLDGIA